MYTKELHEKIRHEVDEYYGQCLFTEQGFNLGRSFTFAGVKDVLDEIDKLQSTITAQEDVIKRLKEDAERLAKQCDEAGNVIASVVGCCTYSSEEKAKTGAYGISHEAFTKINGYIRNYELTETCPTTLHTQLMSELGEK